MNSKIKYFKTAVIIFLTLWCFGIFFPVLFKSDESYLFSRVFLDKVYSLICHRDNAKSFFISGEKLEVCARCTGIYLGALIFSIPALLFPGIKPHSKRLLYSGMVIMATDIVLYSTGIYDYSKWVAFLTGLILGSVCILYIFDGIEEYFLESKLNLNVQ